MRIKINFSCENVTLPNNNKHVVSYLHKCLGNKNRYHDMVSNYSVSQMLNGKISKCGKEITYTNPYFYISSNDLEFINTFITGVNNFNFLGDIKFKNIEFVSDKIYNDYNHFRTLGSGVLLKSCGIYYDVNHELFLDKLKENIVHRYELLRNKKMDNALNITISKSKTKTVLYNEKPYIVSDIIFTIHNNKEISEFIYNNGLGKSTGCTFGFIVINK